MNVCLSCHFLALYFLFRFISFVLCNCIVEILRLPSDCSSGCLSWLFLLQGVKSAQERISWTRRFGMAALLRTAWWKASKSELPVTIIQDSLSWLMALHRCSQQVLVFLTVFGAQITPAWGPVCFIAPINGGMIIAEAQHPRLMQNPPRQHPRELPGSCQSQLLSQVGQQGHGSFWQPRPTAPSQIQAFQVSQSYT